MRRKLLVAIGVALLAIAAAGCGGGDDAAETTTEATPASEWADGFCTAVSTWQSSLEDITGRFTSLSSLSSENLQAAADDAKTATDELIEDIRALGTPDTQSGEEIDDLGSTLETELDSIQATLDETSGITELPGALKDVSSSIAAMTTAFSDTYSTIRDAGAEDELRDALESSSACDDVTG